MPHRDQNDQRERRGAEAIETDVRMIWKDLREEEPLHGAYCQSYGAFKSIYRFVERGLIRTEGSAHVILFSLMDRDWNFLPPEEREPLMKELSETIRLSLRSGDAYASYSSSQFIVMVLGTVENDAKMIAERINTKFQEQTHHGEHIRIDYIVNELHAANQEA